MWRSSNTWKRHEKIRVKFTKKLKENYIKRKYDAVNFKYLSRVEVFWVVMPCSVVVGHERFIGP